MLEQKINEDYKQAMKAKDALRVSTLSFLRAQLKNVLIDQKKDKLEDQDVIAVIKKQVKQREDSIEQYTKGGRSDLAEKETQEASILKSYLPAQMDEVALKIVIETTIREIGAQSVKDMGAVMKAVLGKVAGQADNKMVSQLVKDLLNK